MWNYWLHIGSIMLVDMHKAVLYTISLNWTMYPVFCNWCLDVIVLIVALLISGLWLTETGDSLAIDNNWNSLIKLWKYYPLLYIIDKS